MSDEYRLEDILSEFSSMEIPAVSDIKEAADPVPRQQREVPRKGETVRRKVPAEEPMQKPARKASAGRETGLQKKNVPARESAPPSVPKAETGKHKMSFRNIFPVLCCALSAVLLIWVGGHVNPGSVTVSAAKAKAQAAKPAAVSSVEALPEAIGNEISPSAAPAAPEASAEPVEEAPKIIPIDRYATSAPSPDPDKFVSFSLDEADRVLELVEEAEASGLLNGQEVLFSPDINFYHDSEILCYLDDSILAICWKEVIDGSTCSCAEIKIADASQFRRKIADDTFGSPTQFYASELSRQTNSVVSCNADFYQFRNFGIMIYDGELYRYSDSNYTGIYSMYNCIDNCLVSSDGNFHFLHLAEKITREELLQYIEDNDILFSIAFGPILVENGEVQECTWYPAGEPTQGYSRAGIGIYDDLHYFYMNLNHAPEKAADWTVTTFAQHMHEKGIDTAYGLDGGQTGELLYNSEPYNHIDFGAERLVSDILYFGTCIRSEEGE